MEKPIEKPETPVQQAQKPLTPVKQPTPKQEEPLEPKKRDSQVPQTILKEQ